jgi:hypothetical protein
MLPPEGGPEHPVSGPKMTKRRSTAPKRRRKFTTVSPFQKSAPDSQCRRYRMMSSARGRLQPYDSIDLQPPARSREGAVQCGLKELVPVPAGRQTPGAPPAQGGAQPIGSHTSSPFAHHYDTQHLPDHAGHEHLGWGHRGKARTDRPVFHFRGSFGAPTQSVRTPIGSGTHRSAPLAFPHCLVYPACFQFHQVGYNIAPGTNQQRHNVRGSRIGCSTTRNRPGTLHALAPGTRQREPVEITRYDIQFGDNILFDTISPCMLIQCDRIHRLLAILWIGEVARERNQFSGRFAAAVLSDRHADR